MTLAPNWSVWLRGWFATGLTLAGVLGLLGLLVRVTPRKLVWPATLIGLGLLVVGLIDINFIGGYRPLDGGDDGMTYEGYARNIVRFVLAGDIVSALRGNEPVYYFTPGFRYVRALEHVMFGETYLGYLSDFGAPTPPSTANTGQNRTLSVLIGSNFADGKGNATAYATYLNSSPAVGYQFDHAGCTLCRPPVVSGIAVEPCAAL